VLLEGPVAATDAVLLLLQPHIREPILWNRPQAPLNLPSGETHALILREAAALSGDDQRRLLEWLGGAGAGTQIVSTTERPLFTLVADGLFDRALYYRLNVMLLHVGSKTSAELPCDDIEGVHVASATRTPSRLWSPAEPLASDERS
jgi:hypothetical protein